MLLANKEAIMTVLDTLNFVAFNPLQNNNLWFPGMITRGVYGVRLLRLS